MDDDRGRDEPRAVSALFDEFVVRDSPALLRLAWGLTGDRSAAEDLVQATLERVWSRWDTVRDQAQPGGYARKVAVSLFLSWRRRRWSSEVVTDSVADAAVGDATDAIAVRHSVIAALATLSPKQRAVAVLRYLDDQTEAQTAHALGCSVGTVKTQAMRALRALRSSPHLADTWRAPPDATSSTRPPNPPRPASSMESAP